MIIDLQNLIKTAKELVDSLSIKLNKVESEKAGLKSKAEDWAARPPAS